MSTFQGKRVEPINGDLLLKELEYGKNPQDGNWYCKAPGQRMGNLGGHMVIEHDDGTITVSPSILIMDGNKTLWHGYLEHGVWRSA
jgi:hypothetical protein